ncbi:uncharacterized protein LOC116137323 isoform X1 [Pistacia vera]|uniref:uncharacterized protein LOC116106927 isoform X1 n=1 Tax=Pistacia vera TaxID=55513 RepID=UPI00126321B9|nr:uncharacterized protein LOC116106927 isoform X1 [Pistacia vera]XP_031278866.1 uncharacterized protein LOC116137323 isoform X1 [Pistacia vera]
MSGVVYTVSFKFRNDYLYHFYNVESKRYGGLDFNHKQLLISNTNTNTTLLAAAASSSAAGGASYSEQLLDAKVKQKRKRIAGIDQDELLDPALLADPDSCFCEFKGVHIHHKVYDAESQADHSLGSQILSQLPQQTKKIGFSMVLLHGFGASVFSWNRVMKPLAGVTGSKVLAFDRPAFGLTSRVFSFQRSTPDTEDKKSLNPFSMAFSVLATLYFIDFLAAEKAIIVGHSAGSLVAVNSYFEAPERVAALILIAPAILAPRIVQKVVEGNPWERNDQIERDRSGSFNLVKPFVKLYGILSMFTKHIAQAILRVAKGMADMVNSLYKKLLSTVLRSAFGVMLVRMIIDKFGIAAVRTAWYDSKKVTEHILDGYTKPLRAKGWDRALVEFTAEMLTNSESEPKQPLAKRLHEISCPGNDTVLIVTGDTDRIVPSWNAERLSQAIPGSSLELIKNCGHLPHEEKVEEFVSVVERFLRRAFGSSEESEQAVI